MIHNRFSLNKETYYFVPKTVWKIVLFGIMEDSDIMA